MLGSTVSGDARDLMAQGHFRRADRCQHGSLYPGPPAGGQSAYTPCHPDALINNSLVTLKIDKLF